MSVTVKQHTGGRLHDSQSMWDRETVKCNVVSAHPRADALESFSVEDALRQSSDRVRVLRSTPENGCSVGFGSETSKSPLKQVPDRCDAGFSL